MRSTAHPYTQDFQDPPVTSVPHVCPCLETGLLFWLLVSSPGPVVRKALSSTAVSGWDRVPCRGRPPSPW